MRLHRHHEDADVKIVCVVRDTLGHDVPDVAGLRAYAVHRPYPGEEPEHPAGITAIAMLWLDDGAPVVPAALFGTDAVAYAVDERVRIDYERDWPDGTPSPGPRRVSFVRRAPDISRDDMARHWGEVHLPLARVHHPAIWRYVQNVVVEPLTPDAPDVDGIAELHFRTVDDLRNRFYDSEEGKRIVGEDVQRFLDRTKGWRMLTEETWYRSP
jgi:uncharacterized protein (TIGR02118 family)